MTVDSLTIVKIATSVRRAIELLWPRRKSCSRLCSLASIAIVMIAEKNGIEARFVGGLYRSVAIALPQFGNLSHIQASRQSTKPKPHAWVRDNKNYIDVTLTQFDPSAEPVAIREISDPHYHGKVEPMWFAQAALGMCGYSDRDLEKTVVLASDILSDNQHPAWTQAAGI